MSPPSSVSTIFEIEDAPGASHNTTFAYWHPGTYCYSLSAPGGPLPYGYPPGPTLPPANPLAASMSAFPAAPGMPASSDYIATPCPDCGQVIKVSNSTTYHMDKHRESQRCKRQATRNTLKEEEAKASALRTELFSNTPSDRMQKGDGDSASARVGEVDGKGKAQEVDPVLPQFHILETRTSRKAHRRCQSEPLPDAFESQVAPPKAPEARLDVNNNNAPEDKPKKEKESVICFQCGEALLKRNVRSHVGCHVLRKLVAAPEEPNMKYAVHPGNTCGFCGRAGCDVNLIKTNSPASKYTTTMSSCAHAHSFSLNKARRFSTVMPCTNVPVHCALCPKDPQTRLRPVYWKYNMFYHIQMTHPDHWDWQGHRVRNLGVTFRRLLSISQKELDTLAPGRTRSYPGPVCDDEDDEDPVILNKRAAVETLIRGTSGEAENTAKRLKES